MTMRLRDQTFTTLSTASKQIAGPNPRRKAVVITAPSASDTPTISDGTVTDAASTASTGAKSSYTVPAGTEAVLNSATFFDSSAITAICALELVRGGLTYTLASYTGSGIFAAPVPLQAGDIVQWDCTTLLAASTADFTINVTRENAQNVITISFSGPAVLNQGINLNPNTLPLTLDTGIYGDALTGAIYAIAAVGTPTIGVLDIFGP